MPGIPYLPFLTRLLRSPSDDSLAYNNVRGELMTEANEGVTGGSIISVIGVPATRLRVGVAVAVILIGNRGPSFYGTIQAVVSVNKTWTLFHVRGDLGGDCLLLAPHHITQTHGWTYVRRHFLPDRWLDAFPFEPACEQAVAPQFAPPRSPSPATPPETSAPAPSFSLDDAGSLLDRTARLMVLKRKEEYGAWLQDGCPGQGVSIAEHVALVQEMTEARTVALQGSEEGSL
ncbi:hypothetical protein EVJ58_g11175 [Rhodofomes roseus]|uniref:Uncharacterized protein n=1 Tax=Rhodofomes roseus TaxID=34475 RepID=A0A4Y9XJC0_9APHY|nr:hypothetical protein EVJ58_g11175 [Rhodofomes roseus]